MLLLAANRLEVAVADLEWATARPGCAARRRADSPSASRGARLRRRAARGDGAGLEATRYFNAEAEAFASGAHAAVVRIDRTTGVVAIDRYIAVDDCGRVINPLLVDGRCSAGWPRGSARRSASRSPTTTTANC